MDLDEERKKNWLNHFDIQKFLAHASGHTSGDEIRDIIKEINPTILIPIHIKNSELFSQHVRPHVKNLQVNLRRKTSCN